MVLRTKPGRGLRALHCLTESHCPTLLLAPPLRAGVDGRQRKPGSQAGFHSQHPSPKGLGVGSSAPRQPAQEPAGDWGCLGCGWVPHAKRGGEGPPRGGRRVRYGCMRRVVLLFAFSCLFASFLSFSRVSCGIPPTLPTVRLMCLYTTKNIPHDTRPCYEPWLGRLYKT